MYVFLHFLGYLDTISWKRTLHSPEAYHGGFPRYVLVRQSESKQTVQLELEPATPSYTRQPITRNHFNHDLIRCASP